MTTKFNSPPDSFVEKLARHLGGSSAKNYFRYGLALALFSAGIIILLLWTGTPVLTIWGHDIFSPLDGAWRVYQGQIPHKDFYSPLGMLNFLILALGMALTHISTQSVALSTSLMTFIAVFWSWKILKKRMQPFPAFTLSLYTGIVTAGQCALGQGFTKISTVSILNRYAVGLFMVFLCATLTSDGPAKETKSQQRLEGCSAGLLTGMMFLLKLNFFVLVCLTLFLAILIRKRKKIWWKSFALGLLLVVLPLLIYMRGNLLPLLHDYYFVIRGKTDSTLGKSSAEGSLFQRLLNPFPHEMTVVNFFATFMSQYIEFLVIAVLWIISKKRDSKTTLIIIILGLGSIATTLGNFQIHEVSELLFLSTFLFSEILKNQAVTSKMKIFGLMVFLFSMVPWIYNNSASVFYSFYLKTFQFEKYPESYHLRGLNLPDLVILENTGNCEIPYGERFQDGTKLLNQGNPLDARVAVFDFANPFTFSLGLRSARNSATNLGVPLGFNTDAVPKEKLFSDVNVIMIPKCPDLPYATKKLIETYGSYVKEKFPVELESRYWFMISRQ